MNYIMVYLTLRIDYFCCGNSIAICSTVGGSHLPFMKTALANFYWHTFNFSVILWHFEPWWQCIYALHTKHILYLQSTIEVQCSETHLYISNYFFSFGTVFWAFVDLCTDSSLQKACILCKILFCDRCKGSYIFFRFLAFLVYYVFEWALDSILDILNMKLHIDFYLKWQTVLST